MNIEPKDNNLQRSERRVPEWLLPTVKTLIFAVDATLAAVCFFAAFYLREDKPIFSQTAWAWSKEFVPYAGIFFFVVPIRAAMMLYQGVYRLQGAFSYTAEAFRVFKAVLVGSLLIIAVAFLFRGGFAFRDFSYSRGVFLVDFAFALVVFTAFHLAIRYLQTVFRRRGINLIPTLIVGAGSDAERTRAELFDSPELGYEVVGTINDLERLPDLIREFAIQEVIITDERISSDRLFEAMMQIDRSQRVEFRFAPSLFNLMPQKTEVEQIGVLPVVTLFQEPLTDAQRFVKRASDIVVSTVALIITAPIFAVVSLAVKLDSRGPVFFRQERVGMDGRVFLCHKFRTMLADADDSMHREAYLKNIEGAAGANAGNDDEPVFGKVKDDPRITRIGRFLRRTSLDELPQFFDVLKGDMSVVGARPPIPYEVENYEARHRRRLDMKPGITGLWQVSGRNRLSFEEMVRIDLFYIENWSIWLDLKIILLTLPAVLRGN
ncbi:MAG: sugar transferase [Acidobacteria bacterium]|nr:sugar transferase [Acidobacteriota bacterium]MBK8148349.1 sugar transferase [Acidobacteriota bacterium]MBK8813368.1 sugar transferase [Acidobacteriota bacterium]